MAATAAGGCTQQENLNPKGALQLLINRYG